jgi:hypothetical protein
LRQWADNGWLREHESSPEEMRSLLEGANRKLVDAGVEALSNDGRFQFAYEAILRFAMAALAAEGYRASSQSHHYRSIASLVHTVGLEDRQVRVLDTFRRKRNISVYDSAGEITQAELQEVLQQGAEIATRVREWLGEKHPELLSEID